MVTVRFYGDLESYGKKFKLDVVTAGEALRALFYQIPGLRQHVENDFYRVRVAGQDIKENQLDMGLSSVLPVDAVIHIIPRAIGAKNGGVFSAIAGAVLIVAGAVVGVMTGWTGVGLAVGQGMIVAGAGLMFSGVIMMLTKMPQTKLGNNELTSNTNFSNLDNTVTQGQPIPVCYGEMMIGSKVLSQGVTTE